MMSRSIMGAPSMAFKILALATWFLPASARGRYREEWYAELDEMKRIGIPVIVPALRILRGAPAMGRMLRATESKTSQDPVLASAIERNTWLVLVKRERYSGLDFSNHYTWDNRVPNHRGIKCGDSIVICDTEKLLGAGIIDQIDEQPGVRSISRCPKCRSTNIERRQKTPLEYRCYSCKSEFDQPSSA